MRATKLAFEKRYSDDSGVASAVSLDGPVVRFERHGHSVEFDASDVGWLLYALNRIEVELEDDRAA